MSGPTLDDVTKARCPENKPYKCLPYGVCYDHEYYCSPISRTIEPCFPHSLLEKETDLLAWCTEAVLGKNDAIPHRSCLFACHHRFSDRQLFNVQMDQTPIPQPRTEIIVMAVILVNWLICGLLISSLVVYRRIYFRSQKVRLVDLLRSLTSRGGQASARSRHNEGDDQCTELDDMIRLEPLTGCNDSNVDPEISSKLLSEKAGKSHSETPEETFRVVMEETDVDLRGRSTFGLQRYQTEDSDSLSDDMSLVYTVDCSPFPKSPKECTVKDNVIVSLEADNIRPEKVYDITQE